MLILYMKFKFSRLLFLLKGLKCLKSFTMNEFSTTTTKVIIISYQILVIKLFTMKTEKCHFNFSWQLANQYTWGLILLKPFIQREITLASHHRYNTKLGYVTWQCIETLFPFLVCNIFDSWSRNLKKLLMQVCTER